MKVAITFDIDDELRIAINHSHGKGGRADSATCKAVIRSLVDADLEDIRFDYTMSRECEGYSPPSRES